MICRRQGMYIRIQSRCLLFFFSVIVQNFCSSQLNNPRVSKLLHFNSIYSNSNSTCHWLKDKSLFCSCSSRRSSTEGVGEPPQALLQCSVSCTVVSCGFSVFKIWVNSLQCCKTNISFIHIPLLKLKCDFDLLINHTPQWDYQHYLAMREALRHNLHITSLIQVIITQERTQSKRSGHEKWRAWQCF